MATLAPPRVSSLDIIKGMVMVLMTLDHVRDYTHADAFLFDPTDPEHTTWPIFLTRWITHFCAPTFSLLAGTSAWFVGRRKGPAELSAFLLKRGLWLLVMELTIVNFGWFFDPGFHTVLLITIWSLGISMMVLAGLSRLPRSVNLTICLVLIFGHNLLDAWPGALPALHDALLAPLSADRTLFVGYPLIPWIGVMGLGYAMGPWYAPQVAPVERRKWLLWTGLSACALFLLVTGLNVYGDPTPWKHYNSLSQTAMSFLNRQKYPPSLQYLLMTLGPALVGLAAAERLRGPVASFLTTFGRVPFFFYILHLYVLHALAMVLAQVTGFGWDSMILHQFVSFEAGLQGYGFSLGAVYGFWVLVVAACYPLCAWFDGYKQRHREQWWVSYL